MAKRYTDDELTRAVLLILNDGLSASKVSAQTGINIRALQRHKKDYLLSKGIIATGTQQLFPVIESENTVPAEEVQKKLDETLIARAKFLDDLFETKKALLARLDKIGRKSNNLDALQKAIKTINDIETAAEPAGDNPAIHAKTVNMFQFFNQQLIQDGYKGPELTDADIVKGY